MFTRKRLDPVDHYLPSTLAKQDRSFAQDQGLCSGDLARRDIAGKSLFWPSSPIEDACGMLGQRTLFLQRQRLARAVLQESHQQGVKLVDRLAGRAVLGEQLAPMELLEQRAGGVVASELFGLVRAEVRQIAQTQQ